MSKVFRSGIRSSEITPESAWLNRRNLIAAGGASLIAGATGLPAAALNPVKSRYSTSEAPNSFEDITGYNNFYAFGTGKDDPARHAHRLTTAPWTVKVDGMVDKPSAYALDDLIKGITVEERIYRFRCVEAWSMVIPWAGFPLSKILDRVGVQSGARYVGFETLVRPSEMRGQESPILNWPYREGLTIAEAAHPLTIMAVGVYNKDMPKQNGAPMRLVVPWKYGFKSIKSVVRITLTDRQPRATWNMTNPREYGFFSNVNPEVDHPRWSQATERRIGGGLFSSRQDTLMFNGYADQVAGLYDGMDLRKNF